MTFKIYSYAEIKATPIGELREFAKEIGVKAPTTLPKEALDAAVYGKIKEIEESRRVPSELIRPRGRAAIVEKSRVSEADRQNFKPFGKDYEGVRLMDFKGFFRPFRNGDGLICRRMLPSESDIFADESFVESACLNSGDFVTGKYAVSPDSGLNITAVIESVNGKKTHEMRAPDIYHMDRLMPYEELDLWDDNASLRSLSVALPLKKGGRVVLSHGKTASLTEFNMRLARRLKREGLEVYSLFLGAMPEAENVINELENATACPFDVSDELSDAAVQLVVDAACRQAEEGRDVAIVADNVQVCKDKLLARMLLGSACLLKEGSITVIASFNEDAMSADSFNALVSVADGAARFTQKGELFADFKQSWVKNEWASYPLLDKLKSMNEDLARTMIKNCYTREELENLLK